MVFGSSLYPAERLETPGPARDLARAQCNTIRLKLLKIGAQIRVMVRKVWVSLAESYPYRDLFQQIYLHLTRCCPVPLRC